MNTTTQVQAVSAAKTVKKRSQSAEVWRRLRRNKSAMIGLAILLVLIAMSLCADFIADYEEVVINQNNSMRCQPPSKDHIMGTDEFGRDVFGRLVHGSRISLSVGVITVTMALIIGGTLGAIAGFYGGKLDNVIMRIMDIFLAIPSILRSITIVSALGARMFNLTLAIAIATMPQYARLVRASVLTVKDQEFVEAARCTGARNYQLIFGHILPNCMAPIIVQVTLKVAVAILSTSSLSFLGLGVKPPSPEWGAMLSAGRTYLRTAPHITLFPGLAIIITILSLNLLGDGLRDALDPKLKQ